MKPDLSTVFGPAAAPPRHEQPEAERRQRKDRLAAGFRLFAKHGLNQGVAGHLTARDPEFPDRFWVNPFGQSFATLRASDLSLVGHDGSLLEGRLVNAAAFAIHSEIHKARPDVACAAHAHPVHGTAWSALGRLLDPINQDVCAFYGDHALFDRATGIVAVPKEAAAIARALGSAKAVILRNHGLLTVGRTVDEALWWFLLMERCCRIQLAAEAAGKPLRIPHEEAAATAALIGTPEFGWFQFQPLYDEIVRAEPDLTG
ncbi:MAG: class II aldolase/adducin family protein [Burkholderiales bacterium]